MIETFVALLLAHVLADFVFQTTWIIEHKKRVPGMLVHAAIVLALSQLAVGHIDAMPILALAAVHLGMDAIKTHLLDDDLGPFLADQLVHLATLAAVAYCAPTLWMTGFWADAPALVPQAMLLTAGAIVATRAGGFAIGKLMTSQTPTATTPAPDDAGLPKGGLVIGLLERGLIYVLVLAGQMGAIGFLIAAKSILRFGTVSENRAASEYVIIGTMASFGWAIVTGLAVAGLGQYLPALEFASPSP